MAITRPLRADRASRSRSARPRTPGGAPRIPVAGSPSSTNRPFFVPTTSSVMTYPSRDRGQDLDAVVRADAVSSRPRSPLTNTLMWRRIWPRSSRIQPATAGCSCSSPRSSSARWRRRARARRGRRRAPQRSVNADDSHRCDPQTAAAAQNSSLTEGLVEKAKIRPVSRPGSSRTRRGGRRRAEPLEPAWTSSSDRIPCPSSLASAAGSSSPSCSSSESRSSRRQRCGNAASSRASSSAAAAALAVGDDAVDEPDRERLARVDAAAGQDHVHRPRHPDQPRQPDRAAVDQRHPPAPAEHAEHRAPPRRRAGRTTARARARRRPRNRRPRRSRASTAASGSGPSGRRRRRSPGCRPAVPTAFRSAPAQNTPPSPWSTATAASGSASNSRNAVGERVGGRRRRPRCGARAATAPRSSPARRARPGPRRSWLAAPRSRAARTSRIDADDLHRTRLHRRQRPDERLAAAADERRGRKAHVLLRESRRRRSRPAAASATSAA